MRKVIHQRAGVTEGVIEVELPCYAEVEEVFERNSEGVPIHPKNKTLSTEKEKLT
jgi:hypothetical protein